MPNLTLSHHERLQKTVLTRKFLFHEIIQNCIITNDDHVNHIFM